jgi:hypothetical protein
MHTCVDVRILGVTHGFSRTGGEQNPLPQVLVSSALLLVASTQSARKAMDGSSRVARRAGR